MRHTTGILLLAAVACGAVGLGVADEPDPSLAGRVAALEATSENVNHRFDELAKQV